MCRRHTKRRGEYSHFYKNINYYYSSRSADSLFPYFRAEHYNDVPISQSHSKLNAFHNIDGCLIAVMFAVRFVSTVLMAFNVFVVMVVMYYWNVFFGVVWDVFLNLKYWFHGYRLSINQFRLMETYMDGNVLLDFYWHVMSDWYFHWVWNI